MKTYNIFLDDIRDTSDAFVLTHNIQYNLLNWNIVRNYDEFISLVDKIYIETGGLPSTISLDHDLADEHYQPEIDPNDYKEKTGMECAKWLIEFCMDHNLKMCEFLIHSQNTCGSDNMQSILSNFKKFQQDNLNDF